MADLTPDRIARLRVWAERRNAHMPHVGTHLYDGSCPWCRRDDIEVGACDGYFDGNAHDLALELLDEIDLLRGIISFLVDDPEKVAAARLLLNARVVWQVEPDAKEEATDVP